MAAPDEELRLYLLQLVQALKFDDSEKYDDAASSSPNDDTVTSTSKNSDKRAPFLSLPKKEGSQSNKNDVSLLARFLIDRAASNLELANDFYWYLKVELKDVVYGAHYFTIFSAFEEKLRSAPIPNNYIMDSPLASEPSTPTFAWPDKIPNCIPRPESCANSDTSAPDSASQKSIAAFPPSLSPSMYDILEAQDRFVSGIMESQCSARDIKGRKEQKEARLRQLLASNGFDAIDEAPEGAVPLPSAPHVHVAGVLPATAFMFKSALYPAVVEFRVAENVESMEEEGTSSGHEPDKNTPVARHTRKVRKMVSDMSLSTNVSTYKVIFKTGDDLRQDQLVMQLVRLFDGLLKRVNLDLCLKPYTIIATSPDSGLVEFVSGSSPISQILANNTNSILAYFQKVAPHATAPHGVDPDVLQTYTRSLAGYCVITYILGIGDRHLDNIMLLASGHFFHIDFGFIFGRDPKGIQTPFRLTREMIDGMGGAGVGPEGPEYRQFASFATQAYNVLRKSAGLVLNLLRLTSEAGIEDLSHHPTKDADGVIASVEEKFRLDLSDEMAENYFQALIAESLGAFAPRVMEVFHQIAVARR
uniref:Phosphatidylinositol 3-kinase n=2 Tax=Corethron hystrix TaxID=216773 RepID=A0A7S1BQ77_9STRA